MQLRAQVNCSG